jgi:uncharacterized membrane protein
MLCRQNRDWPLPQLALPSYHYWGLYKFIYTAIFNPGSIWTDLKQKSMVQQVVRAPAASVHKQTSYRIEAIDLLRGIVMVLMAIDHTRDFFHITAFTDDPLNLATTTPLLFFTRWITHFCAPVFVFLSGASIYLQSLRKRRAELSSFLLKRGLWLVFVEVVVISFALTFDPGYHVIFLQVIWAIGISMILLAAVIWLPFYAILALGLVIVFGHNLLDYFQLNNPGPYSALYSLLHVPGGFPITRGHSVGVLYPFLPWTGIMMLGYCFGRFYKKHAGNSDQITIALGAVVLLIFLVLRAINLYGDPLHWSTQKNLLYTIFSFVDTQKYPPSLLYSCMTLGPAIIFLGLTGRSQNAVSRIFIVFGRVPFFYYVLHFYIIHSLSMILFLARGHKWEEGMGTGSGVPFKFILPGEGYNLAIVYLIWILLVITLYPLCKWFNNYKMAHRNEWLSYL